MAPRPLLLVALTVLAGAAVAGCLGAPSEPLAGTGEPAGGDEEDVGLVSGTLAAPNQTEPPAAATIAIYPFTGHITLGAGTSAIGYVNPTNPVDLHYYVFTLEPGARALVAELQWNDPMQDLDLELMPPGCDQNTGAGGCIFVAGGAPGAGDSPMRFVLTDAELLAQGGEWRLAVWAKTGVNVAFDGAVSIFHGVDPEDGFTAL